MSDPNEMRRLINLVESAETNEKTQLNELDMSFTDWIVAGAGIELGRYALEFAIFLFALLLGGGIKALSSAKARWNDHRDKQARDAAAQEAQKWIQGSSVYSNVQGLTNTIRELDKKKDRSKSDANKKKIRAEIREIVANRKTIKQQLATELKASIESGEISQAGANYIISMTGLKTYM